MPRIALVTCEELPPLAPGGERPALDPDSAVLLPALADIGVEAESVVWSDPAVDWSAFDRAVLRSPWDYDTRTEEFVRWVRSAGAATDIQNSPDVVLWNLDKRYLRELEAGGVPVVPTIWVEPGEDRGLEPQLVAAGWQDVIVKPSVDLGARNLVRVPPADAPAAAASRAGAAMVQPFLPDLERSGELSIIYLAGQFSHAILKRPASGDFRVQPQYGGVVETAEPPFDALEAAERALHVAPAPLLYARVDLVRDLEDRACVIELEVLDPVLFLADVPGAAARAAQVFAEANS